MEFPSGAAAAGTSGLLPDSRAGFDAPAGFNDFKPPEFLIEFSSSSCGFGFGGSINCLGADFCMTTGVVFCEKIFIGGGGGGGGGGAPELCWFILTEFMLVMTGSIFGVEKDPLGLFMAGNGGGGGGGVWVGV